MTMNSNGNQSKKTRSFEIDRWVQRYLTRAAWFAGWVQYSWDAKQEDLGQNAVESRPDREHRQHVISNTGLLISFHVGLIRYVPKARGVLSSCYRLICPQRGPSSN